MITHTCTCGLTVALDTPFRGNYAQLWGVCDCGRQWIQCDYCDGNGIYDTGWPDRDTRNCPDCDGEGIVEYAPWRGDRQ